MRKCVYIVLFFVMACNTSVPSKNAAITAEKILGNKEYQAICYSGYRTNTRDVQPTIAEIKEDLKILAAMKIKVLRTYNVHYKEVANLLHAITEMKRQNNQFEMYVMLGAWIDCKNAWTKAVAIHDQESERNAVEIDQAVRLANKYPNIVKIIAVGNEAMVKWATDYYVTPNIILKWVTHLQKLKSQNKLPNDLWITTSDNFASWGGGEASYHSEDLKKLYKAVDYISMHTYPMHDTHYNPSFWGLKTQEKNLSDTEKINVLMQRSRDYAIAQYAAVKKYMRSIGINKPVHIGETGWATQSNEFYGTNGSRATDEYKSALFYDLMRKWSNKEGISCFYFEAFDENWKNKNNPKGAENHFGLISLDNEVKYVLWNQFDNGAFQGVTRNGKPLKKSFAGNKMQLMKEVKIPTSSIQK